MRILYIISLIISVSCIEHRSQSEADHPPLNEYGAKVRKNKRSKVFRPSATSEKYLNLTKRTQLNLDSIFEKYKFAETITINSGNRASISFRVEELGGSTAINVVHAKSYDIFVKDTYGRIYHERIR